MLNVLITGANGMLGSCLANVLKSSCQTYLTGRQSDCLLGLSWNYYSKDLYDSSYDDVIDWSKPDVIIHCAAITDVNYCEKHPQDAFLINSLSVQKLLFSSPNSRLVLISSDAVYGDERMSASTSKLKPQTAYGLSKLKAERYLLKSNNTNSMVMRTTILGSKSRPPYSGFVDWLVGSLLNQKKVSLYDDNFFTPISIWDLSNEIRECLCAELTGIWNVSGSEPCSKFLFGYKLALSLGLDTTLISADQLSRRISDVPRCLDQTMSCLDYVAVTGRSLPGIDATIQSIQDHLGIFNGEFKSN